jgi:hypothetical protein
MPTDFVEEDLRFTFDDNWNVVKLDEHPFFRERLMPMQLTRAVDFLALYRGSALYLLEVKDFRGSAIELKNHEKMCSGDTLCFQVARKVKDSVACVAGAARCLSEGVWAQCADVIRSPNSIVKVVFWMEFDLGRRGRGRNAVWVEQETRLQALTRENALKAQLKWLTKQVSVSNQVLDIGTLPGVTVRNEGRVGNR